MNKRAVKIGYNIPMDFNDFLKDANLNETQLNQLSLYCDLLIEWNEKFNLTAITDRKEIYIKHFLDCLTLNDYQLSGSLADIGSGAGFPGIVLKIANPELDITLIEPNNKRVSFLNEVIKQLKLGKITVVNERAEDFAQKHREHFDFATARAVSALNILLELSMPMLKVDGHFLAMKGPKAHEEIGESYNALTKLHAKVHGTKEIILDDNTRIIIDIVKAVKTDSIYPRNYSQIKKKPL